MQLADLHFWTAFLYAKVRFSDDVVQIKGGQDTVQYCSIGLTF